MSCLGGSLFRYSLQFKPWLAVVWLCCCFVVFLFFGQYLMVCDSFPEALQSGQVYARRIGHVVFPSASFKTWLEYTFLDSPLFLQKTHTFAFLFFLLSLFFRLRLATSLLFSVFRFETRVGAPGASEVPGALDGVSTNSSISALPPELELVSEWSEPTLSTRDLLV